MGDTHVDAELVREIARSLDRAARTMSPTFDRAGFEDVVQAATGRHRRIDTLAGSTTGWRNFGAFENGQRLKRVYGRAQRRAVRDADERADRMRHCAEALRRSVVDLESADRLGEDELLALGRLAGQVTGTRRGRQA